MSSSGEEKYSLQRLKDFLASKKINIIHQFVADNSIVFVRVRIDNQDDNVLIYKHDTAEAGRVVISKFVLWLPRIIFNSIGLNYFMNNYHLLISKLY